MLRTMHGVLLGLLILSQLLFLQNVVNPNFGLSIKRAFVQTQNFFRLFFVVWPIALNNCNPSLNNVIRKDDFSQLSLRFLIALGESIRQISVDWLFLFKLLNFALVHWTFTYSAVPHMFKEVLPKFWKNKEHYGNIRGHLN